MYYDFSICDSKVLGGFTMSLESFMKISMVENDYF